MKSKPINRKEFLYRIGKAGAGVCLCAAAAAAGMNSGQTKPGDKTVERAAKRMEFGDVWLRRFFAAIDQTLDEPTRKKLMTANGKACYTAYAGPPKQKAAPDALEKFMAWIAEKGKEKGYSTDGKAIFFEFVSSAETGQASPAAVCLCSMAEAQAPGEISPTFCLCSVGYVQEIHERRFGRPVEVELVDSVLRGGKRCKFRITVA